MRHERWWETFREAPEIFDAFRRAEDADGRIVAALRRHVDLRERVVLEIGCGTGRLARDVASLARSYTALEPVAPMLRIARNVVPERTRLVCARAQELPVADASVDVVLAGWVFANLPASVRARALDETSRVLRRSRDMRDGVWLIENHWQSEFQDVRGLDGDVSTSEVAPLLAAGFRVVETVDTEIRFDGADDCERIVGHLCGDAAAERLRSRPRSKLEQRVVLLQRDA